MRVSPGILSRPGRQTHGFLPGALLLLLGVGVCPPCLWSQDPMRFEREVRELLIRNDSFREPAGQALVFTGSSSIRLWGDLPERFPGWGILNTGFGGSQASDLLFFIQPLVLDFRPGAVFVYEGDNDLAEGKRPGEVLLTLEEISRRIHERHPGIPIIFIAAKPSPSRWRFRGKFRRFNRRLERWTRNSSTCQYADVWNPMLRDGSPDESLFIEDGLHMNAAGYDIWQQVLQPLIENIPKIQNP